MSTANTSRTDGFDPARLHAFMLLALPGLEGAMQLERIGGGQSNPTYFVSYDNRKLVLRKQPPGPLLPSAHAIDREYRVMSALDGSGVPVPPTVLYYPGDDVAGTPFYLMERIEGRVFGDCALPGVTPAERRAMFLAMAETLALLHRVDWQAHGLEGFGTTGNYYERQIRRWTKQWQLSRTREIPAIDRLAAWLPQAMPGDDRVAISHGDFRIGNLMFHPTEARVVGVLDWELSSLGDPMADLAYSALAWRLLPTEYMGMRGNDFAALGIPTEDEYLEHYYRHADSGQVVSPFHYAFALFRLAVIAEGVAARAKSGATLSENAEQVGKLSAAFAQRALEVL